MVSPENKNNMFTCLKHEDNDSSIYSRPPLCMEITIQVYSSSRPPLLLRIDRGGAERQPKLAVITKGRMNNMKNERNSHERLGSLLF